MLEGEWPSSLKTDSAEALPEEGTLCLSEPQFPHLYKEYRASP